MDQRQPTSAWSSVASALGKGNDEAAAPVADDDAGPASSPWNQIARKLGGSAPARGEQEPEGATPASAPEVGDDPGPGSPEPEDTEPEDTEPDRPAPGPSADLPGGEPRRPRVANPRRFLSIVGGAAVVIVLVVVGLVVWPGVGGGGLPGNVALRYKGKDVTKAQINAMIPVLANYYGQQPPAKSNKKAYDTFLGTAAKAYVIDQIVTSQATARGITATDSQIDQGVSTSQISALAKAKGLTLDEVQAQLRLNTIEPELVAKIGGTAKPSTTQINQVFTTNQSALGKPETRAVSRILVTDQSSAQTIVSDLQQGQSFATLANTYSEDAATKANGGQIGTIAKSLISSTAFAQAAFTAQLNVPFGPVSEGATGAYDVGVVTAINPATPAANDATTSGVITKYLTGQQQAKAWTAFMKAQLAAANVTYAKDYTPDQPLTAPALPVPSLTDLMAQAVSQSAASS